MMISIKIVTKVHFVKKMFDQIISPRFIPFKFSPTGTILTNRSRRRTKRKASPRCSLERFAQRRQLYLPITSGRLAVGHCDEGVSGLLGAGSHLRHKAGKLILSPYVTR